jgi:hypothetical protein
MQQMTQRGYRPQGGQAGPVPSPQPPKVQYVEDFFVNEVDTAAAGIANGATSNLNFIVQADSDFKLVKMTYFADIALAAQTDSTRIVPLVTIQVVDTGSGRQLFSSPMPIASLCGTGQLPFILPVPRIFKARSNVAIILANFSAASTYNIRVSFIGTKIFALGN